MPEFRTSFTPVAGHRSHPRRRGERWFVTPRPHKRAKSSYQRFAAEAPNERWQLDITHYRLADDTDVEILNVIDDHSRFCLASRSRRVFTAADVNAADVNAAFTVAAGQHGDPAGLEVTR